MEVEEGLDGIENIEDEEEIRMEVQIDFDRLDEDSKLKFFRFAGSHAITMSWERNVATVACKPDAIGKLKKFSNV